MTTYHKILVAVDLSEDSQRICHKALEIAQQSSASIILVHIIELFYQVDGGYDPLFYPAFEPLAVDESEMQGIAQKKMDDLIVSLAIPADIVLKNEVLSGTPKIEIIRLAKENKVDLIVCGSHGRSGFELLLGSTANAILHHAPCDVLAVRTAKTTE